MKTVKNLTGRQVARLRNERGWTQEQLSDRLYDVGWIISRSEISKIEGGSIYVHDFQLFYFAQALGVLPAALLPSMDMNQPVHETVLRCIRKKKASLASDAIPEHFFPRSLSA